MLFYLKQIEQQVIRRIGPQPPPPHQPTQLLNHSLSFIIIIFIYLSSLELPSEFQFQAMLCVLWTIVHHSFVRYRGLT